MQRSWNVKTRSTGGIYGRESIRPQGGWRDTGANPVTSSMGVLSEGPGSAYNVKT